MAVDHALLENVQAGGAPTLRLYSWSPACLSFGRNQAVRAVCDPARVAALGVDIVRRLTGGLAVLHDREVTYSVVVPVGLLGSPRESYGRIGEALVTGLRLLGVPAGIAADETVARPAALRPTADAAVPCFAEPVAGEVVADGRKLVGSAQRCENRTILQHGSVLLGGDQSGVAALLGARIVASDEAGTTLERLLGRKPAAEDVTAALLAGFRDTLGAELHGTVPAPGVEARARELESRYASAEWTWRR